MSIIMLYQQIVNKNGKKGQANESWLGTRRGGLGKFPANLKCIE